MAGATILESLIKLQKRAVKIVVGIGTNTHINNLIYAATNCNILLFNDLVQYLSCIFMFNVFHNNFPVSVTQSFIKLSEMVEPVTRQHNYNFVTQRSRLNIRHNFVTINGITIWNSLPNAFKIVTFFVKFKHIVKSHILSLHDNMFT